MNVLYAYPALTEETLVERHQLRNRFRGQRIPSVEVRTRTMRHAVHQLLRADCLVVPGSVQACTEDLERLKNIARYMDIRVMPIGAFLHQNNQNTAP